MNKRQKKKLPYGRGKWFNGKYCSPSYVKKCLKVDGFHDMLDVYFSDCYGPKDRTLKEILSKPDPIIDLINKDWKSYVGIDHGYTNKDSLLYGVLSHDGVLHISKDYTGASNFVVPIGDLIK